jgi:hypothetical protein
MGVLTTALEEFLIGINTCACSRGSIYFHICIHYMMIKKG